MQDMRALHQVGKDAFYKTWHASGEHIFIYFHSDGGSIVSAGQVFPICKGALVFIGADTYHYTMPEDPACYRRSKLILSRERLRGLLGLLGENSPARKLFSRGIAYTQCEPSVAQRIEEDFSECLACKIKEEGELLLFSCCMRLMLALGNSYGKAAPEPMGMMAKAVEYIHENLTGSLDVESICRAVNISKFYFCRRFKAQTGMTVMDYVLNTRLMLAKTELKHSASSVSEISERHGFSSVSYFCRVFKEREGCSPLQYRKRK